MYSLNGPTESHDIASPIGTSLDGVFLAGESRHPRKPVSPPPPANTPPQISSVANQTVAENGATGALAFTVSDAETPATGLVVTAASGNAALVPLSGISLNGSGTSRTVTVTPAAGQFGTASITLTVTDAGGLTATDTFTLTVPPGASPPPPPANTPPQISTVANQTVPENGATGALAFTVSDAQTPATGLIVTASSTNTTLVPQSAISLGGTGGSRTVTINPAAGQSGTASITLTVADAGGLTDSDTFTLTVTVPPPPPPPSGNTPPHITPVGNQTLPAGGSTGAVPFTVSDAETPAASLTVTTSSTNTALVPQSAIIVNGAAGDRTVTITPAAGQIGTATITLTVTDAGGLTATDTFTVTVPPPPPPPPTGASDPRILLTPDELTQMRQAAAANTPAWQAYKARLDQNLTLDLDLGAYQGSELTWIADYALGYQVLKDSDPATASGYADKALALLKSGLNDYQVGSIETRQFLARGDGTTTTYTIPNGDFIASSMHVYVGPVFTLPVVKGATDTADSVNFYSKFLKVSNTPDGSADYTEGVDWVKNPDLRNDYLDWAPAGAEPATGATYYVTMSTSLGATNTPFTLNGQTFTITDGAGHPVAIGANQAVYVEYIYGTPSADGS
ncbi:MAG TPA: DUF4815 domain-containing protein, partial [Urbifossiella sp.]|nr:DUF4815 domain-containing protein [Urbifossiella sp.]